MHSDSESPPGAGLIRHPVDYAKAVAYVAYRDEDGRYINGGTAFQTSVPSNDATFGRHMYWVTANHVVIQAYDKGVDGLAYVRANGADDGSMLLKPELGSWVTDDIDPTNDVAVLPVGPIDNLDVAAIPLGTFLPTFDVEVDSPVFIAALPPSGANERNVQPIMRSGRVVAHSVTGTTRLGTADYTLIDAPSVGGHSGSPCSTEVREGFDLGFVGMVVAHPDADPGKALVVPAERILRVLNQPTLSTLRHQVEERGA